MNPASLATITCPTCGLTSTVPVDALLVSVAASGGVDAATAAETAGIVAWTCDGCTDLASLQIDWSALLTLVTAGVTLIDDATHEPLPPHPEHPMGGVPLTRDDLLALHELLASDAWFDEVAAAGCVNP